MDSRWRHLQDLAIRQHGHFTTRQAEDAGLTRPALHYRLAQGFIERPERGIYRFVAYPPSEHEREAVLMLWTHLEAGTAFSHETSLRHFELGDAFPSKYHLSVPRGFRRRPPADVTLHESHLSSEDVHREDLLRYTTPARTILDLLRDDHPMEQLQHAYAQAVSRGLIRRRALEPDSRTVKAYVEHVANADGPLASRREQNDAFLSRLERLAEAS